MPFIASRLAVSRYSHDRWELVDDLHYEGREEIFTVPAGFITDFATVPRIVTWLVPKYGKYTLAAILHDYLCTDGVDGGWMPSRDADGLFRRVLRELDVPFAQRWMMWAGVRWGAAVSGDRARTAGLLRDLPLVLLISVLSLPVVVPGVLGVLLGLLVYAAISGVLRLLRL